ncbi:hypothetical protein VTP01DRAFT_3673 [Rhizomucor pusillus]|uniref:uncharacterized protein n=1 Tax=Rhizomucor pusillus TaxID=4840 RepID=UPI003743DF35
MAKVIRGISLEEWEEKTQLTEDELRGVYELQDACSELPLPSNWLTNDRSITSPAFGRSSSSGARTPEISSLSSLTPLNAGTLSNRLKDLTTRPRSSTSLATDAISSESPKFTKVTGTEKPIETLQQFLDWFSMMEADMETSQEDIYRNHLSVVLGYLQSCNDFLTTLEETSESFKTLHEKYSFVEERTRSLQNACEDLLKQQENLTALADALAERLKYFNELEPIAKAFNSPGEDICLMPQFIPMLEKLDACIQYMQSHLQYRDAELYLMRLNQCLTRGMTLIKMHVVNAIRSLGYDIYKQSNAKTLDQPGKQNTLLYVKFRMIAPTLKPLTAQVEQRCKGHTEFQSLYQEILNAYFQIRQNLLSPVMSRKITQLTTSSENLAAFARDGCGYIISLCLDEFNLFRNFFREGEDELYSYLDLLTSYLYDQLRPRIIHENNISILSELCAIFQTYVFRGASSEGSDASQGKSLDFGYLLQNILEDAQGKLVFRAQAYIHNDIQNYVPKPEDFLLRAASVDASKTSVVLQKSSSAPPKDAPATLMIDDEASDSENSASRENGSPLGQGSDTSRGWYPTLQKTLWILSKLYQCVQTSVFEDLAHEAVSLCSQTLKAAADMVALNKSRLDKQLFLVKHLLILKEQLAPFEANIIHSGKELDFSHVTDTLSSLQQNRSLIFNPNALIDLAQRGMPRVVEISLDSRREIDQELKRICEEFINDCVQGAVEPLASFMIRASTKRIVDAETETPSRGSGSKDEVQETMEQFKEAVSERLRFTLQKLREYVNDYKIEQILMKPIEMNILEHYRSFLQIAQDTKQAGSLSSLEAMGTWIAQLRVSEE